MPILSQVCPVRRVTCGPFYHFFGYYDKSPWSVCGKYLLAVRVAFMRRQPSPEDMAVVGIIDTEAGNSWQPLAETTAWNWQQGCMLRWLDPAEDRAIICNIRDRDRYAALVVNIDSRKQRYLPMPIYALSPAKGFGLSLNFSRVHRTRPGYGYVGIRDPWERELAPSEDGIYYVDLATGEHRLIISLAEVASLEPDETMVGAEHWFNHLQINPSGTRFAFLHRWHQPGDPSRATRLLTASPDGDDIALLAQERLVSHYDWMDDKRLLAWSRHNGQDHYHLYQDHSQSVEIVGADLLDQDGHCSYSPNRRWLLTDTYPDALRSERTLILYDLRSNTRYDIGRFYSSPELAGPIRCDLHPRWNRDGTKVCIDSVHEGQRQMYVIDVSQIVS